MVARPHAWDCCDEGNRTGCLIVPGVHAYVYLAPCVYIIACLIRPATRLFTYSRIRILLLLLVPLLASSHIHVLRGQHSIHGRK